MIHTRLREGGIIKQHRELVTLGSAHDHGVLPTTEWKGVKLVSLVNDLTIPPTHSVLYWVWGCRLERTTLSQLHWMPRLTSLLDPTFPEEKNAARYSQ